MIYKLLGFRILRNMKVVVSVALSEELVERIDRDRQLAGRSAYVEDRLRRAMEMGPLSKT